MPHKPHTKLKSSSPSPISSLSSLASSPASSLSSSGGVNALEAYTEDEVKVTQRVWTRPDIGNHGATGGRLTQLNKLLAPPAGNFRPPPSSDPAKWNTIFDEVHDILFEAHGMERPIIRRHDVDEDGETVLTDLVQAMLENMSATAAVHKVWREGVVPEYGGKGGCIFREMLRPKFDEDENEVESSQARLERVIDSLGCARQKAGRILSALKKIAAWTPDESEPLSLEWLRGETLEVQYRVLWGFKGVGPYVASSVMTASLCHEILPMGTAKMNFFAASLGVTPAGCSSSDAAKWVNQHMPDKLKFPSFMLWWEHSRLCKKCGGNGGSKSDFTADRPRPAFLETGVCPLEHLIDRRRGAPQQAEQAKEANLKAGSATKTKMGAQPGKRKKTSTYLSESEEDELALADSDDDEERHTVAETYSARPTRSGRYAGRKAVQQQPAPAQAIVEDDADDELKDVDTPQDSEPPRSTASSHRARSASNNSASSSTHNEDVKPEPSNAPFHPAPSANDQLANLHALLARGGYSVEHAQALLASEQSDNKPPPVHPAAAVSSSSRKRAAADEVEAAKGKRKQPKRESLGTITLSSDNE